MLKITLIAGIVLCLMRNAFALKTVAPPRCTYLAKCTPYYQELIWTLDGNVCRPIQNGCLLGSENCNRINQGLPELEVVDREVCATYCPRFCTKIYRPVKAEFPYKKEDGSDDIETLSFGNLCMLQNYSCGKARAYLNVLDGWKHEKAATLDASDVKKDCENAQ